MKKITLVLVLYGICSSAGSQSILFQDNFEKGRMNAAWKISYGGWSVPALESKGLPSAAGQNNFALASMGNAEISVDIPVINNDPSTAVPLNFNFWVHSKDSKGTVNVLFLQANGDSLYSLHFTDLTGRPGWELFNQSFKIPAQATKVRLKLGEKIGPHPGNTVYFQNVCLGCNRRR